ncbi:MAG: hypothetical protein M3463_15255 [Verrucomicrobiota bacterium]|nr:hypothetical protein [Verrucomicrobiota bacterium]
MQAEALGFGLRNDRGKMDGRPYVQTWVIVPFWALPLATAVLPALWLKRRWRQHRRAKGGMCLACGYDLRHTPDRCPECGATPAAAAIAA